MQILADSRILAPGGRRKFTAYELKFDPPQIHRYLDHTPDLSPEIREGSGKYVIGYKNRDHREVELFALLTCATAIDFNQLDALGECPPEEQLRLMKLVGQVQSDFEHNAILAKYRKEIMREAGEFRFVGGGLISVDPEKKLIQLNRGSASTGFVPWSIIAESFEHDKTYVEYTLQIILGGEERDTGRAVNRREEGWYREMGIPVILLPKSKKPTAQTPPL